MDPPVYLTSIFLFPFCVCSSLEFAPYHKNESLHVARANSCTLSLSSFLFFSSSLSPFFSSSSCYTPPLLTGVQLLPYLFLPLTPHPTRCCASCHECVHALVALIAQKPHKTDCPGFFNTHRLDSLIALCGFRYLLSKILFCVASLLKNYFLFLICFQFYVVLILIMNHFPSIFFKKSFQVFFIKS